MTTDHLTAADRTPVPRTLTVLLDVEDQAEAAGQLAGDDRLTCSTCQTWATPQHRASDDHRAAARRVRDEDLAEVICMAPDPGGINGQCWWPLPCENHPAPVREIPWNRPPWLVRHAHHIGMVTVAGGVAWLAGYATGVNDEWWRPAWLTEHLLAVLGVALTGLLSAAAAAVTLLACRSAGHEPATLADGEVPDGR